MWPFAPDTADEHFVRFASPNERRCIVRESYGFYRALVVGGILEFASTADTDSIFTYTYALQQCIDRHPQLSVTVSKADTESPYYAFCPRLDLGKHIQILAHNDPDSESESETRAIQRALPSILDAEWPPSIPPWKVVVLPFSGRRCFIGFSYSHTIGDGMSGLAFTRSFLSALQTSHAVTELTHYPIRKPFNPPFDTAKNIPICWSFLLGPLLDTYLPRWLASLCGFVSGVHSIGPGTWTGAPVFYDAGTYETGVKILTVDARVLQDAVKLCRMNGAKLTGLLHQLIINALSGCLPESVGVDSFASGTAINMRGPVGISDDEMGLFVSVDFQTFPLQKTHPENHQAAFSWDLAKAITVRLAARARQLHDQPIGLLRYLRSVHSWTMSKLGARREGSYELSNLGSLRPSGSVEQCEVKEMVFCQPADVTGGPPLTFNAVSCIEGNMSIAVSWQIGALGLGEEGEERDFVGAVCRHIGEGFKSLSERLRL